MPYARQRLGNTPCLKSFRPAERAFKLADAGGLFLLVQPNGSKLWRYKFRLNAVEGLQALGAFPEVTLADARHAHAEPRKLVAKGTFTLSRLGAMNA